MTQARCFASSASAASSPWHPRAALLTVLAALTLLGAVAAWGARPAHAEEQDHEQAEATVWVEAVTVEVRDRDGSPVTGGDLVATVTAGEATVDPAQQQQTIDPKGEVSLTVEGDPDAVVELDAHTPRGGGALERTLDELADTGRVKLDVEPDAWGTVEGRDGAAVEGVAVVGWSEATRTGEPPDASMESDGAGRWELHRIERDADALEVVAVGVGGEGAPRALPDGADAGGDVSLTWLPAVRVELAGIALPAGRDLAAYALAFRDGAGAAVDVAPSPFLERDPREAASRELAVPDAFVEGHPEPFIVDERVREVTLLGPQGAVARLALQPDPDPERRADVLLAAAAVDLREAGSGAPVDGDVDLAVGLDPDAEGELTTLIDGPTTGGRARGRAGRTHRRGRGPVAARRRPRRARARRR